ELSSGGYVALNPDGPITPAPHSMVAGTLQGKKTPNFVLTNKSTSLSQADVEAVVNKTKYANLMSLVAGNSPFYFETNPTSAMNINGQNLINVANPTNPQDAATKNYSDNNLGGQTLDSSGVGVGIGGGRTLIWDQVQKKWVTGMVGSVGY